MSNALFSFLKSVFIFQDAISWIKAKIPIVLEHNLAKYAIIKKAFYLTAMDDLEGDYLEFGIFTGSSFVTAIRSYKQVKKWYGGKKARFFGYDSFTGFGKVEENDQHPFYIDSIFSVNEKKVRRYIQKKAGKIPYTLIKGYFEETLKGKSCKAHDIKKVRVAFIDCDMKAPAALALDYIREGLQEGSILILDDFFSYKGSKEKGAETKRRA